MALELSGIRNVIFDLGGVILNIDYHRTIAAFTALGIADFDAMYSQAAQSNLFDLLETGNCTPQEFRDGLKPFLPAGTTDAQIDNAWNALLEDLPAERLTLLAACKQRYQTFLLSNTNSIHYDQYIQDLEAAHGLADMNGLFHKVYLSHEVHLRKPDVVIFEHVLNDQQLKASETLFIDDSIQHIDAARKAGIYAYHLTGGETILDLGLV